jgi:MFS family permease
LGVVAAAAFILLTRPVRHELRGAPERTVFQFSAEEWRTLLGPHMIVLLIFGAMLEPFNFHTSNQLLSSLMHTTFGKGEEYVGGAAGLTRLCLIAGALTLGMFFEHVAPHRRWAMGMIGAGASVVAMGLAPTAGVAVAFLVCFQFLYPLNWCGNSVAVVEAAGQERRTLAMSLMLAVMYLGMLLAGIFQRTLLGAGVSLPMVFVACGAIGALGGLIIFAQRGPAARALTSGANGVLCGDGKPREVERESEK